MVDAIANMALETLRDLLIEEAKFLSGVSGQVEEVHRQLSTIHCFLKDADRRKDIYNSHTFRGWIAELRQLSTQAENVLERYAIEVTSKREGENLQKKLKRFTGIEFWSAHEVRKEIEDSMSRMADLTKKLGDFTTKLGESSSSSADDTRWSRKTYGHEVEEHFVGMKDEIKELESKVTNDDRLNGVISICGMGGLGKTTLATKIYQREAVQRCFQARAWICISQQFQPKAVFQGLLKQLLPKERKQEIMEMDEDELVRELYDMQKGKRCLVVLDDIWEVNHWTSLSHAFPIAEARSKVLLTSRNEMIAATGYVHKLKCLSEDEGWELLQKIALPINYLQVLPYFTGAR